MAHADYAHDKDTDKSKIQTSNQNNTKISKYQHTGVKEEIKSWRNNLQTTDYQYLCKQEIRKGQMTAAILASGGLLDTMSSIRSGFKVIWGSDNDTNMQKLWENMTGMASLGPAENINYNKIQVPDVLFSGMPCPDWTNL